MGWNGSGVFTKTHSWVADAANGIKIRADRHDTNDTDFTNGINNCITKDGQNTPTANLPMGTYRHTGVSNAAARNQYATMAQVQDSGGVYVETAGTANAYTAAASPAITAYASGQRFRVEFDQTCLSSATININSVGTANLVKYGSTAIAAGDVVAGRVYDIVYDGSNFQVAPYNVVPGSLMQTAISGASSANLATGDKIAFLDANDSNALKSETVLGILKLVYPVGSYYLNETDSTNPGTLLGFGTWTAVTDKFLVGHGSTYTSTGGAATATLAETNLPSFSITTPEGYDAGGSISTSGVWGTGNVNVSTTASFSGSATPFSIIPPYQAVYIWKRTA